MATVFLAEEPRLDRLVAIKVMLPSLLADGRAVARFEREARTMARLKHPSIVTVHEIDQRDDIHYLVMEYVPGRSLSQVLAGEPGTLPIAAVMHWIAQTGSALAHAHRQRIIHRDLKPSNILLDSEGDALVTDFGIAKVAEQPGLTSSGMIVGTPIYISPEQCEGGGAGISAASDQYSLAVVTYELLTGTPPFQGNSMALLYAHMCEMPQQVSERRSDCPSEISDVLNRMLAKYPGERFPEISAAISALQAVPVAEASPLRKSLRDFAMPRTLKVRPDTAKLNALGRILHLQAFVVDWNGIEDGPVQANWSVSDNKIAVVDENGTLSSLRVGQIKVTASWERLTGSCELQVWQEPARLSVDPEELSFSAFGQRAQLLGRVEDEAGHPIPTAIRWQTSDPSVADLAEDGWLTARGNGTVKVRCEAGTLSVEVPVTVRQEPARLHLKPSDLVYDSLGETKEVRVSVRDSEGHAISNPQIEWELEAEQGVVEAQSEGSFRSIGDGKANIHLRCGQLTAVATAEVRRVPRKIEVSPDSCVFEYLGETAGLKCTIRDGRGNPMEWDVEWKSSDSRVVTVSNMGLVEATGEGEATVTASGGDEVLTSVPIAVRQIPVKLSVQPDEVILSALGESVPLSFQVSDAQGRPLATRPRFSISDPSVATVDVEGLVTARAEGTALATARLEKLVSEVKVVVHQRVSSVRIIPDTLTFSALGDSADLEAEALDSQGRPIPGTPTSWRSSDPEIAAVDGSGRVEAVGRGVASVTADCSGVRGEIPVLVDQEVGKVEIQPRSLRLSAIDASGRLSATVTDRLGHQMVIPVSWTVSDPEVAVVAPDGTVTAEGNGKATVTARCGGVSARATVKVEQSAATLLVVPRELVINSIGETRQVVAELRDGSGHEMAARFAWSSDHPEVATVDSRGIVQAVGKGSTRISVQSKDFSETVQITVFQVPVRILSSELSIQLARPGEVRRIQATVLDASDHRIEMTVDWRSSDPDVAAVDPSGRVTAVSPGSTLLFAAVGELRTVVDVAVRAPIKPAVSAPETGVEGSSGTFAPAPLSPQELPATRETVPSVAGRFPERYRSWIPQLAIAGVFLSIGTALVVVTTRQSASRAEMEPGASAPALDAGATEETASAPGLRPPDSSAGVPGGPEVRPSPTTDRSRSELSGRGAVSEPHSADTWNPTSFRPQVEEVLFSVFGALRQSGPAGLDSVAGLLRARARDTLEAFLGQVDRGLMETLSSEDIYDYRPRQLENAVYVSVRIRFRGRQPVHFDAALERSGGSWIVRTISEL